MSLVERITQALNDGISDPPWNFNPSNGEITDAYGQHVASARTRADGRLIAAAPGLLAECAQRLDPHMSREAIEDLLVWLRAAGPAVSMPSQDEAFVNEAIERAADLLEQVFLDPQETK